MEKDFNRHHCVPSSRKWLTNDVNCVMMDIREHNRLHQLFGNATCVEQICKVLLMNKQVWSEKFKEDLLAVLDNHINNYYRDKVRSWFDKQEVKTVIELESGLYS